MIRQALEIYRTLAPRPVNAGELYEVHFHNGQRGSTDLYSTPEQFMELWGISGPVELDGGYIGVTYNDAADSGAVLVPLSSLGAEGK